MRGESQPATSATSSATSESSFLPSKDTPAATTAAPGFTMSAVIRPGEAGRGDQDVGLPGVGAEVGDAGVHHGDRGVGVGPLEGEQVGERTADGEAATDDDDVLPLDGDVVVDEQRLDAGGGARQRPVDALHEVAEVDRVEAVDVLGRVDRQQRGLEVEVRRGTGTA